MFYSLVLFFWVSGNVTKALKWSVAPTKKSFKVLVAFNFIAIYINGVVSF